MRCKSSSVLVSRVGPPVHRPVQRRQLGGGVHVGAVLSGGQEDAAAGSLVGPQ